MCGSLGTTRLSSWLALLQNKAVLSPDKRIIAVHVNFMDSRSSPILGKRERCIRGGAAPIVAASPGTGYNKAAVSEWGCQSINKDDPVEVALDTCYRDSTVAHVTSLTSDTYRAPWSHFVDWCASRQVPRCPPPTNEMTMALYLQSVVGKSTVLAPVKSASYTIALS